MSLARSSAIIGGLTLVSRVLGFIRDLVVAAALGAGPISDAYFAALRFPNLFRRLFAEGAFSQAFVPVYARRLEAEGAEVADRIASEALSVLVLITGAITAIAIVCMPLINSVLFAGYVNDPETFALANLLTQITMPYLVAITMATLYAGVLNARGRFVLAAAAPIVFNLSILVALAPVMVHLAPGGAPWLAYLKSALPDLAPAEAAVWAAAGVSLSGILQAGLVYFGASRQGAHAGLRLPRITPNVKLLVGLAVPSAIAGGAFQINIMISQILASLERGAITFLNVADRLYQLPLGLIGVAVGVAMMPRLARLTQAGDGDGARRTLNEALALAMAFTLPAAAAVLAAPAFLIEALFVRGAFTVEDAHMTAQALVQYGWGIPAFVLAKILAPAFFARQDTRAPMRFALVSVVLNIAFGAALFFALRAAGLPGFVGLAIATSLASWVNVGLMVRALHRRGHFALDADTIRRLTKIGAASAALGILCALIRVFRPEVEAALGGSKELAVSLLIFGGGSVYFLLLFGLRAVTVGELRGALRREAGPSGPDLPGAFDG